MLLSEKVSILQLATAETNHPCSCFHMEFDVDSEGFGVLVEYDCASGTELFIATLNILLLDQERLNELECWY